LAEPLVVNVFRGENVRILAELKGYVEAQSKQPEIKDYRHAHRRLDVGDTKMDAPTEKKQGADLRDYLAAERTFLAWIRTGLALMGFGFVVARFGLFLQQLRFIEHVPSTPSYGVSVWFGTALIAVGVVVNLSSAWRHVRLIRELDRAEPACSRSLTGSRCHSLIPGARRTRDGDLPGFRTPFCESSIRNH